MDEKDIVERLRESAAAFMGATHTITGVRIGAMELEAAVEIEQLRKDLAEAQEKAWKYDQLCK
jgi:hypothetical protein